MNRIEPMIFIHLPKTGGVTLKGILANQYKNKIEFFSNIEIKQENIINYLLEQHDNIDCVIGHIPFGLHKIYENNMKYCTILRDPVKRMLSSYRYIRYDKSGGFKEIIPEYEINDPKNFILNIDKYSLTHGNNAQVRLLSGAKINSKMDLFGENKILSEEEMFNTAIKNIKKYFAFVGTTENFMESVILMKKYFNWTKPIYYIKRNITKTKEKGINFDAELIKLIKQKNKWDIKLYDYVNNQLKRQLEENKTYLSRELKKITINNSLYTFYRKYFHSFIKFTKQDYL